MPTALGQLSAWISHDVRSRSPPWSTNAIAGSRFLAAEPANIDAAARTFERIVRDAHHAADVLDSTRALFKKTPPQNEAVDLNRIIADTALLVEAQARRSGVDLRIEPEPGLPSVFANRVHLQQVVLNLLVNAIDAMVGSGTDERRLRVVSGIERPGQVFVAVQDTGPGVAGRSARPPVRCVLHHQAAGHGDRVGDLPFDHRILWRAHLDKRECAVWQRLPVLAAAERLRRAEQAELSLSTSVMPAALWA